ncbi:TIGR03084 family metal-binding protein [Rugosimonospora africana]|uniref:TIGR03084 family protein n=1 Tax=Rugosimonospora africana TaxID=556532 RepID=A0A8J3QVD9_9ACTN|nr:TIGR03084 family metal-binding protein [Rugosimonospora africana]GIH18195.1 TIGR03084 family protein [Rugosimonospora africana]
MVDLAEILVDLRDESEDLDRIVAGLPDGDWQRQTPAEGWTIAHQISHLTWTDRAALRSVTDPGRFAELVAEALTDPTGYMDRAAEDGLAEPAELLRRWRDSRAELAAALAAAPPRDRLPWFSVDMTPASMATARLMETWAHGEDVSLALHEARLPARRLRHVAWLGWRTLPYGFLTHGRPVPTSPVYVELQAADGGVWAFGPPDAADRVTGPALDFCLLVTQRRHRDDLALDATGQTADEWLDVAQAFAGPPGAGRRPKPAHNLEDAEAVTRP